MAAFKIHPALGATKQYKIFLKRIFKGYKTSAYFAARLTSPPASRCIGTGSPERSGQVLQSPPGQAVRTGRGELDSENSKLFSISYQSANNGVYIIVALYLNTKKYKWPLSYLTKKRLNALTAKQSYQQILR